MLRLTNLTGCAMREDTPLVSFMIEEGIVQRVDVQRDVSLPIEFRGKLSTEEALELFLLDRVTPPTRYGINEELAELGMYYDPTTLIKYNKGNSVSDNYWIRCEGEEQLKFSDVQRFRETHSW